MLQFFLVIFLILFSFSTVAQDTVLKLYRPFGDFIEQAAPSVKKTLSGECYSQSRIILREDAWRCSAEGTIYDPCFVRSGKNKTEALCPQSPWVGDSIQIMVKYPLENEHNKNLDMSRAYPWAIELTNGEYCQGIYTEKRFDNMRIRYQCNNKNYLVGHLQRCKSVWSMLKRTPEGVIEVELKKAWF